MTPFDLLILGAGPAGLAAAREARHRNLRAAVVSREEPGGTCLHRGCIPVKALLASAAALRTARAAAGFGVRAGATEPDWPAMLARARAASERLARGAAAALEASGAAFFRGEARLAGPGRVLVTPPDAAPLELAAPRVLLAPGSAPARPALLPGSPRVLDSDAALRLPALPRRILVLGGGAIGCEFASLFADLGVAVELVEREPRLLPGLDRDCGVSLAGALARRGVRVRTGVALSEVRETEDGVRAALPDGRAIESDLLLAALGRRPATDGLGLETVGLSAGPAGEIPVDAAFRTAAPGVSACGDAVGRVQLAPWAEASAEAAVAALCGEGEDFDGSTIPACVFSHPEVAAVGLSEEDARARGVPVRAGRSFFRANGRAVAAGGTDGFAKVLADPATGRLLGAFVVGPGAAESIGAAAAALRHGLPAAALRGAFPHPSFGEALAAAAEATR